AGNRTGTDSGSTGLSGKRELERIADSVVKVDRAISSRTTSSGTPANRMQGFADHSGDQNEGDEVGAGLRSVAHQRRPHDLGLGPAVYRRRRSEYYVDETGERRSRDHRPPARWGFRSAEDPVGERRYCWIYRNCHDISESRLLGSDRDGRLQHADLHHPCGPTMKTVFRKGGRMPNRFILKRLTLATLIIAAPMLVAAVRTTDDIRSPQGLTVHEWGTFTSVAGIDGMAADWRPAGGPTDLPCFVELSNSSSGFSKVAGYGSPNLLGGREGEGKIRMETPVLYFYSPHQATVNVR